jgi:iron-sulfur cluster assembly protein
MGLKITELALEKAKAMRVKMQKPDDWGLSVGLRGGGCSGFMYDFDFMAPPENEELYRVSEHDGLKIYCDKKSFIFLVGTEIDYEETLMTSGFTFKTPYATRACGCGESVSFDMGVVVENGTTD